MSHIAHPRPARSDRAWRRWPTSLRSGIWYWRRRCPRALPCGDHRTTYEMSLKTGDRRTAIRRGLALDLALEEVMIMDAPPSGLTIRTLLVNLRNELVLEGEMERASRPTAPSAAFVNRAGFPGGRIGCVTLPWRRLRFGQNCALRPLREECCRWGRAGVDG
ncbi:DUF6538 domain-containing protein [Azospirillum sp. BE72]|uniref:DUF6538 domain-containing protein n=1 Tax=Azospirillum sp. BE72 TaxID=2817776 RepID=UPI00286B72F0|nr:DUF6538 domain-containing protein [Azospirillum sp. BE72]